MSNQLEQLVHLTRTLGQPHRNYVIIGEGNTSTRVDDASFLIKASGQQMESIGEEGFVQVNFAPILEMLDSPPSTLTEQNRVMSVAKVDQNVNLMPSVEVSFHAMLLHECAGHGVKYIGHTHPVSVNKLMCSNHAENFAKNRMFPDEAVLCGPESVFVPYEDPGLTLAIVMREKVREYMVKYDEAPKVILLANHGFIALGSTPAEILNITAMGAKAAEILAGAYSVGEPVFMSKEDVMHIYKRPDEIYRRSRFVQG